MKLDFFCREQHHQEHARAIYDKMPASHKGDFITDPLQIKTVSIVFSYRDLREVSRAGQKVIYAEHGAGYYYNEEHPSYAGSSSFRENIILRLSPNEMNAKRDREVLSCPIEVIGVPKLDKYFGNIKYARKYQKKKICFSFHWDCNVSWATRSAYRYYIDKLTSLKDKYEVYGHGHPRIINRLRRFYRMQGIKTVDDFSWVVKNCDVYLCDNSSTSFEFAFFDKAIVHLNCPIYDKKIEQPGCPRFWKYADIGSQVENYTQLPEAIEDALNNRHKYQPRVDEMKKEIFTFTDGKCSERAVEAIIKHLDLYERSQAI